MRAASIVKIHCSFWIAAGVFWAMGLGVTFLMVAASVSAHEIAHVLVAKAFGCKIGQLKISALGEMALVNHMDKLSAWKRTVIIAAGPACNLLLWGISVLLTGYVDMGLFGLYNLVLCGFNLLPIFPLDGARLFQLWVGNWVGIMRANRWALFTGRVCCVVLMLLGVVQAILYAPNFTMLIAGFALWRRNRSLQLELTGAVYMAMLNKSAKPAKIIRAYPNQPIADIVDTMGWDHMLVLIMPDHKMVTEKEVINYVIKFGLNNALYQVKSPR